MILIEALTTGKLSQNLPCIGDCGRLYAPAYAFVKLFLLVLWVLLRIRGESWVEHVYQVRNIGERHAETTTSCANRPGFTLLSRFFSGDPYGTQTEGPEDPGLA
jgi:hypothetical protein